jgi:hypothetical protein
MDADAVFDPPFGREAEVALNDAVWTSMAQRAASTTLRY